MAPFQVQRSLEQLTELWKTLLLMFTSVKLIKQGAIGLRWLRAGPVYKSKTKSKLANASGLHNQNAKITSHTSQSGFKLEPISSGLTLLLPLLCKSLSRVSVGGELLTTSGLVLPDLNQFLRK